jgi:hypothetical protein
VLYLPQFHFVDSKLMAHVLDVQLDPF